MVLLTARHLLLENLTQAMALPLISVSGDQERQWPEPCKTSDATGRHILSVSNPESAWASLLLGQGAIVSNGCSNYAADSRVQAFPLEYTCLLVCRQRRDLESLAALLNEMADFYQNHFHAMEKSSTYK